MPPFPKLSLGSRVGLGALLAYSSFESYMYINTLRLIEDRKTAFENDPNHDGRLRFSSASINGIFVNPFEEYRPQTAFEFLYVRIIEAVDSLFGGTSEKADPFITSDGAVIEVDDLLKPFKPNLEMYRKNSKILRECHLLGSFEKLVNSNPSAVPPNQQMLFTWLGQSCALVQISGINILTDPIFGDHLFENNIGPKRLVPSPMSLEDIDYATDKKLDIVLVSHNHPDHLELSTARKIGNSALWVVPLGLKSLFEKENISNVVEMDWWETISLNKYLFPGSGTVLGDNYELVFVPAMHWSGRHVVDSNTSLWGSFILRRNGVSVLYHAGDTGFSKELFEKIGLNYGPIFLSLLPIGQYCPSWHQSPRHISPEECMKIASRIEASHVMGIHFGTFKLSSEPTLEPKQLFLDLARTGAKCKFYNVPEMGLTYEYNLQSSTPATPHEYSKIISNHTIETRP